MCEYDTQKDGIGSYYAAVAAKKARGDTHWPARQPDDPGIDGRDEPLRWHDRPFSYRPILSLVVIEAAAIVAFLWFMGAV
jgi:hypothetical protein